MDLQTAFNITLGLAAFLGGLLVREMWQALKDLQTADKALTDKVHAIETLVAGQYVSKDEFSRLADAIFTKLDRIEDKLDGKADKSHAAAG